MSIFVIEIILIF